MNKSIIKLEYDNESSKIKIIEFTESNGQRYIVEGECNRCGQCCMSRCNHLAVETINGENIYSCVIYEHRPTLCAIFPGSVQDILDNPKCSYKLRLIEK